MVNSINRIPSINLPLTNDQGVMHPIWYEYFRSVISGLNTDVSNITADNTIIAGSGIEGTGAVSTVNVGEGEGIVVDDDSVGVDIIHQINSQAALEDEILIADASIGGTIRKTSLRDVSLLSVSNPGGENTYVQYNNAGVFAGHSGLTYDGAGSLIVNSTLTINGVNLTSASNAGTSPMVFKVPAGSASTHYTFRQVTGTGSSDMPLRLGSNLASTDLVVDNDIDGGGSTTTESRLKFARAGTTKYTMGLDGSSAGSNFVMSLTALNTGQIYTIDGTTNNMAMSKSFLRKTTAGITASVIQTQGQGALTSDINEVSTCANANDTVTLPVALAGRCCFISNNGAATLQIFPASGDNLGAGLNTSTTLAAGGHALFVAYDSTNWEQFI